MLAYIKGTVEAIFENGIILENNGIGYDIKTPDLSGKIAKKHEPVTIYTYLYVREDLLCLYGFLTKQELETFKLLITVSGIGPKAALAVLSTLSVEKLHYAILTEDTKTISKTPGIGPKGAKRLIMELKDKITIDTAFAKEEVTQETAVNEDVVSIAAQGLMSLGYSSYEALKAIGMVQGADAMDEEQLLKEALKKIMFV